MPRFRKSGNAPNIPSAGIVTNLGLAWLGLGKRRDRMTPISYRYEPLNANDCSAPKSVVEDPIAGTLYRPFVHLEE